MSLVIQHPVRRAVQAGGVAVALATWLMWAVPTQAKEPAADGIGDPAALLSLSPAQQPGTYRNMDRLYAVRTFHRGANVAPLPAAARPLTGVSYELGGKKLGLDDFFSRNRVGGLLVIKDGHVVIERYGLGNDERSRWTSFSVGKSVVSTLVGAAIKDGSIGSVSDPVTKYLPALRGSAYDGVSLRNMLQMSSGVKWDEDYTSGHSDIGRLLDCTAGRKPGCIIGFMKQLPRAAAPGTRFNYNTGETHLLGMVVSAATHKHLADYLSEKIWSRYGMETDGYWILESVDGQEMAGGSLSMTLRDYGRFGQFVLGGGAIGGAKVLPDGWFADATSVHADAPQVGFGHLEAGDPHGYGYQWWLLPSGSAALPHHDGAFMAEGVFGQFIYVNRAEHVVAVIWSAWPAAWVNSNEAETTVFLGAVVAALH